MADVTINNLTGQAPTNNDVFPFSTTGVTPTTYKASLTQIKTALGLATVATTGNYNDLTNKPTIPTVNSAQLARAWVNFDGQGSISTNQTIRSSYNIASVYKFNTGSYTISFSSALSNSNYAVVGMIQYQNNNGLTFIEGPSDSTTSNFKIYSRQSGGPLTDSQFVCVAIFSN